MCELIGEKAGISLDVQGGCFTNSDSPSDQATDRLTGWQTVWPGDGPSDRATDRLTGRRTILPCYLSIVGWSNVWLDGLLLLVKHLPVTLYKSTESQSQTRRNIGVVKLSNSKNEVLHIPNSLDSVTGKIVNQ